MGLGGAQSFSSSSASEVVKSLSEDFSNEHIDESVRLIICSCKSSEALEEVPIKPGEIIFSACSVVIEAFDSKLDSRALPGSALIEVALDPDFKTCVSFFDQLLNLCPVLP